jgi:hypothetical protein
MYFAEKGIPNQLMGGKVNPPVTAAAFPPAEEAVQLYHDETGGHLTDPRPFQTSPFGNAADHHACERSFQQENLDLRSVWDSLVNRQPIPFQNAILRYIDIVNNHL